MQQKNNPATGWCPALKMHAGEGVGQAQVEAHLAAGAPDLPVKLFPNQDTQICRKSTQLPVDGVRGALFSIKGNLSVTKSSEARSALCVMGRLMCTRRPGRRGV